MPHGQRLRDYLTRDEVSGLLRAAKKRPRYGARNHAMILHAYRHGPRASELASLRVTDLNLSSGTIYCRRAKGSRSSLHPKKPDEVVALARVLREPRLQATDYVFPSERAERMSRSAFWRIVSQAGHQAGCTCSGPGDRNWSNSRGRSPSTANSRSMSAGSPQPCARPRRPSGQADASFPSARSAPITCRCPAPRRLRGE